MNESERLAIQMECALSGGAWHGPSWREVLDGVTRADAEKRPIPAAHSIGELVLHATTWHDAVRRRLEGDAAPVSDAEDWPKAVFPDDRAWLDAVARLFDTGRSLCETIRHFPAARLDERRPGLEDTWFGLIAGELQHMLYHAGQVIIVRKGI